MGKVTLPHKIIEKEVIMGEYKWYGWEGKNMKNGEVETSYNVSSSIYIYNNQMYGTRELPYYSLTIKGQDGGKPFIRNLTKDLAIESESQKLLLISTDDPTKISKYYKEIPGAQISGKYRLYKFNNVKKIEYWGFPCKFVAYYDNKIITGDNIEEAFNVYNYNINLLTEDKSNKIWWRFWGINESGKRDHIALAHNYNSFINDTDISKVFEIDFGKIPQDVPAFFKETINVLFVKIYENTYTIKSSNGSTLASVSEADNIIKANLSAIDNYKTLNLIGIDGNVYTLNWTSYTPADKVFLGLSPIPNSSVPLIPVGKEVSVSFNDSTTLYEVYGKYKPLSTRFEIHTYKSSAEQNRVDKTNFLVADMIISGVLREASSLIHPSITFTSDIIPTFNYVYIPIFNRYYYVTDITSIKNKLWQMSLTVDVLMTYKEALLACTGYIDRNENEYNGLIPDGMISLQKGETIETNFVTNELFTETQGTYVLQGLLVSQGDVVTDTHTGSSGDEHSGGGGNFGN